MIDESTVPLSAIIGSVQPISTEAYSPPQYLVEPVGPQIAPDLYIGGDEFVIRVEERGLRGWGRYNRIIKIEVVAGFLLALAEVQEVVRLRW